MNAGIVDEKILFYCELCDVHDTKKRISDENLSKQTYTFSFCWKDLSSPSITPTRIHVFIHFPSFLLHIDFGYRSLAIS
jgi:hypothetical protein